MNKRDLITIIIAMAVIALAVVLQLPSDNEVSENIGGNAVSDAAGVMVVSSQVRGNVITVDSVNVTKNGFIVIYEDNRGVPGGMLGVSDYLNFGTLKNVPVELSKGANLQDNLYAIFHVDNGDQAFNPASDQPALTDSGIVMVKFLINR